MSVGDLSFRSRLGLNFTVFYTQSTSGPVSTEVGDRIRVQFPVRAICLGIVPATQVNLAWPSLRG